MRRRMRSSTVRMQKIPGRAPSPGSRVRIAEGRSSDSLPPHAFPSRPGTVARECAAFAELTATGIVPDSDRSSLSIPRRTPAVGNLPQRQIYRLSRSGRPAGGMFFPTNCKQKTERIDPCGIDPQAPPAGRSAPFGMPFSVRQRGDPGIFSAFVRGRRSALSGRIAAPCRSRAIRKVRCFRNFRNRAIRDEKPGVR